MGNDAATVFFQQLEKRLGIKQSEVVHSPEAFRSLLGGIFGSGGRIIERSILVTLSERSDLEVPSKDFAEAISVLVGGAAPMND